MVGPRANTLSTSAALAEGAGHTGVAAATTIFGVVLQVGFAPVKRIPIAVEVSSRDAAKAQTLAEQPGYPLGVTQAAAEQSPQWLGSWAVSVSQPGWLLSQSR